MLTFILTAIPVEYKAVRKHLINIEEIKTSDGTIFEKGKYCIGNKDIKLIIGKCGKGNVNSALYTERALKEFKPDLAVFVGIAGGIKDVKLGDVLVADKINSYEGLKDEGGLKARPDGHHCTFSIVKRAEQEMNSNPLDSKETKMSYNVYVGPICSGEKVLADIGSDFFDFIKSHYNDSIAVDMESKGFTDSLYSNNHTTFAIIRGISDLIKSKSVTDIEGYQVIASDHASELAFRLIEKICRDSKIGIKIKIKEKLNKEQIDKFLLDIKELTGNKEITLEYFTYSSTIIYLKMTGLSYEILYNLFSTKEFSDKIKLKLETIEEYEEIKYMFDSKQSIPKELTTVSKIKKEEIIGREDDLKHLREILIQNKEIVLLNGMGGIGKTTLASVYANEYYDDYEHIVWFTIEKSLEETIISNYALLKNLGLENEKPNLLVEACLYQLRNLINEKPNLLILDNAASNLTLFYDKLPKAPHWHVLVTSRERIEPFNVFELDFLSENEALDLFKKHCNRFTDEEIIEIVNKIEYHTLTIEILSKSAMRNGWSFVYVKEALEKDAKAGIDTEHSKKGKIERIKSYLAEIFDLKKLIENEIYLLKQFVALPNIWIDLEFLNILLQVNKFEWKDDFKSTLEDLFDKGYLQKNCNTISYKLHPVLSEVFLTKLQLKIKDIKFLIETATDLLYKDIAKDNPIDKFNYILFGDSILRIFNEFNTPEISTLQNNMSLRCKDLGEYEKARYLLENALKSDIKIFGESHPNVAIRQSNLALVYQDLGDYEKAKDLLIIALKSDIKNFGENHYKVVTRKTNLALVYQDLRDYEKAKDLLEDVLRSNINNFGDNHPNVAMSQSNLALVYRSLKYFDKAIYLLKKALKSDIENYGEIHPNVANRKNNLASIYYNLGDLKKAYNLFFSSYQIFLNFFGDEHPSTKNAKEWLDATKKKLNK